MQRQNRKQNDFPDEFSDLPHWAIRKLEKIGRREKRKTRKHRKSSKESTD